MKIVQQTPTKLVLQKEGQWVSNAVIPGILLSLIGLVPISIGIVNIFTDAGFIIYILMGIVLIVLSLILAGQEEEVTFYFDIIQGCIIWKRRSIFEMRIINIPLGKIVKVVVSEHTKTTTSYIRTSKYSTLPHTTIRHTLTLYKISLRTKSNKRIHLTESIDENFISHLAFCIAEFLQVPLNTPF